MKTKNRFNNTNVVVNNIDNIAICIVKFEYDFAKFPAKDYTTV